MQREPIQRRPALRDVEPRQQPHQLRDRRRTGQRPERGQGFVAQRGIRRFTGESGERLNRTGVVFTQRADHGEERGRDFFGWLTHEHRRQFGLCGTELERTGDLRTEGEIGGRGASEEDFGRRGERGREGRGVDTRAQREQSAQHRGA